MKNHVKNHGGQKEREVAPMYVLRRTTDPDGDLERDWSAPGGLRESDPERAVSIIEPFFEPRQHGESAGDYLERARVAGKAGFFRGYWAPIHYRGGLSCHPLESSDLEAAREEANYGIDSGKFDGATNGKKGIGLRSPVPVHQQPRPKSGWGEWYIFEAERVEEEPPDENRNWLAQWKASLPVMADGAESALDGDVEDDGNR